MVPPFWRGRSQPCALRVRAHRHRLLRLLTRSDLRLIAATSGWFNLLDIVVATA